MATVVAAIFGLFVGIAGFRLLPGLRARVGIPDWPNSASPLSNGNDPGLGQNRLRDRQARKMAWNTGL